MRANGGTFDVDHEATGIEIVANNRSDWIGWPDLAKETINELTVEITARVIDDVAADVICVVEAVNRPSLDGRRSYQVKQRCATAPSRVCPASGPKGIRTPDLLAASQALYQLSYGPGDG